MCKNWYKPDKLGRELDLFMSSKVSSRNEINMGFRQNKLIDRKGLKGVTCVFLSDVNETKCSYCCENHAIPFCTEFKLSVHNRIEIVKKQRLCFLCLRVGCKAKPCKLCAKRHHVSLHFPKQNTNFQTSHSKSNAFHPSTESRLNAEAFNPTAFPPEEVSGTDSNAVFAINQKKGTTSVFLSSVKCFVKDSFNEKRKARGLLDVGSMTNLITKKLGFRKEKVNILVKCLNDSSVCVKNCVTTEISNSNGSYKKRIKKVLVVDKITDLTPVKNLNVKELMAENINLADDSFYAPGPIDCLLGAEIPILFSKILCLGFMASGSNSFEHTEARVHCGLIKGDLNQTLKMFWELENVEVERTKKRSNFLRGSLPKNAF
ncbi:integrase catalytic domain-containing protein [Trichonephila clavipes]|nr:integrase catalytic domain-containing protein [Trichonephila clavipes]